MNMYVPFRDVKPKHYRYHLIWLPSNTFFNRQNSLL